MQQEKFLRNLVDDYQIALKVAEFKRFTDSITISKQSNTINRYKENNNSKDAFLQKVKKEYEIKEALLKQKMKKRFSVGIGAGFGVNGSVYVGLGINYRLFNF